MIVLKLGGSLFKKAPEILGYAESTGKDILVVPGGGDFANAVRKIYDEYSISEDAAHWMAVLAMNEYAYYLSDKTGIPLTGSLSRKKGIRIATPYEMMRRKDELPHSWDVTSDTIAVWIAHRTGSGLVKATDVDGILANGKLVENINASQLLGKGETCVDISLPGYLIKYGMDALVVNGLKHDRVTGALTGKVVTGTTILGK